MNLEKFFNRIAWVLFAVSVIGLVLSLAHDGSQREKTQEALSVLEQTINALKKCEAYHKKPCVLAPVPRDYEYATQSN